MYIENFKFPTTFAFPLPPFFKVFPGNCITKHFLPQTFSPLIITYKNNLIKILIIPNAFAL